MRQKNDTLCCWVQALCATALLCVAILGFGRVGLLIDDVIILRALSGFSGVYPDFLPFTHSVVVWPLVWLHQHFPSIHWYSWMLLGCFYLALTVILKCMLQRSPKERKPLIVLLWLGMFVLLWLGQSLELNFTNVSTLLGCAALAQMCSFDAQNTQTGRMVSAVGLAAALAAWGYGLRMENMYPMLGFCGLGAISQLLNLKEKEQRKHFICCLLIPLLTLGLLAGWRTLECRLPENQPNMEWQNATEAVMDYQGLSELPEEMLSQLGWTREGEKLFKRWYFLDSSTDAQAYETIAAFQREQQGESLWSRIISSQKEFWHFFAQHPAMIVAVGLMLLLAAFGCSRRWLAFFSLVASYLLLSYLAFRGRFLMRAVLAVMGPEMTFLLMLNTDEPCARFRHLQGKCLRYLFVIVLIAAGAALQEDGLRFESSFSPLRSYRYRNSWSLIDEYAAQSPETLFVVDTMADDRLFPDMLEGRATNVLYFGGWQVQDSDYQSQLRRFGIDPQHMDGTLFLQDNVCLVSMSSQYASLIQAYIQSLCDRPVVAETVDTFKENYWVTVIRFHLE